MEEKKLEIIYDHYKDTFENIKNYLQRRNTYTLTTIALIGILSIEFVSPAIPTNVSNELIKKNIGEIKIDYQLISSLVLFMLMWSVLLYYQINFTIEKMYVYIHKIENDLSNAISPFEIGREGKNYLDNYPILSSIAHRIYTWLFPLSILGVAVTKWFNEKNVLNLSQINGYFIFDTLILFIIVVLTLLYLSNRHFNDFNKKTIEESENEAKINNQKENEPKIEEEEKQKKQKK